MLASTSAAVSELKCFIIQVRTFSDFIENSHSVKYVLPLPPLSFPAQKISYQFLKEDYI